MLVGEDNPLSLAPEHALYNYPSNCAGWRLQRILGFDDDAYLDLERTNLCNPCWERYDARCAAEELIDLALTDGAVIVALGRKVMDAFGRDHRVCCTNEQLRPFHWYAVVGHNGARCVIVALPHPSGRNAAAWDVDAVHRARRVLEHVAPGGGWGSVDSVTRLPDRTVWWQ